MQKIISLIILVSPFICRGQVKEDSLLLIKKGELQWLLEVYKEDNVLKKRVVIKDKEITALKQDTDTLRKEIKAWKTVDSLHIKTELILSQEAVKEKGMGLIYKGENRKLRRQNRGLKLLALIIGGIAVYEEVRK